MRGNLKKILATVLTLSLVAGLAGCDKDLKEPKPTPKSTAKVDAGNANAEGKGEGQSDIPLIIASTKFSKKFNPFLATSQADRQVVDLTQVYLVTNDRSGRIVYKGIDGELREYNGKSYTYYGASDVSLEYDKKTDTTTYRIKLRDDLVYSDGEKLTIDDVIFSMYVFCDNDYEGSAILKEMPIKGLVNYLANSTKAEKLSDKKVAKYIKKNYKKLSKTTYGDKKYFDNQMNRQARIALSKGKGKKVKKISGIKKVNDYEMKIITKGYSKEMTSALKIPICALHYYGDTSKYNLEQNKFGFKRGNISAILANKTNPVGAGAYRFVKFEDDVIYFNSNELYYLGCPEIAFLQLKDMTSTLQETNAQIQQKLAESQSVSTEDESQGEASPQPTINPVAEVMEVVEGTVDVINATFSSDELQWIVGANSNNKFSGNKLDSHFIGDGKYHYIGMNAANVAIGNSADSNESKYLRKAFATIFSDARAALTQKEGANVRIINYPVAAESWLPLSEDEDKYAIAYSKNIKGETVFDSDDKDGEAKTELVVKMALEYLEKAGYQVQQGKVTAAPSGASLQYTIWVVDGKENELYPVVEKAAQVLSDIGITLKIQTIDGEDTLAEKLSGKTQQLWVGSRDVTDMDMAGRYGSGTESNLFGIKDKVLDGTIEELQNLMSSKERREKYQRCFDQIMDWAVEVPVCEFYSITLFSSKRVDEDTLPQDTTLYYSWLNEIQKVCMD